MAYDEHLAERVRQALRGRAVVDERAMFGGLAFMVHGHMCCGLVKDKLMIRVDPDLYDQLLTEPGTGPMDFTGKPMRGFLYVSGVGISSPAALRIWVSRAVAFAKSRPEKTSTKVGMKSKRRPNRALQPTSRARRKATSRKRAPAARG